MNSNYLFLTLVLILLHKNFGFLQSTQQKIQSNNFSINKSNEIKKQLSQLNSKFDGIRLYSSVVAIQELSYQIERTNSQVFQRFILLPSLSIITGLLSTAVVLQKKHAIAIIDSLRSKLPILAPLIGSLLVCFIYTVQEDINIGPATILQQSEFIKYGLRRHIVRFIATVIAIGSGK